MLRSLHLLISRFGPDSRLFKNLLWNVFGTGIPMLVAVVSIPRLIEGLGMERFGILSLAWIVVGYFTLFDLGLGRAMTQLVAQKIGSGDNQEVPNIFWNGMILMTLLGCSGAVVSWLISPWLVETKLAIAVDLRPETLHAFYWLSASIPVVIAASGLRGILEAYQRFDVINIVRIPLGMLTYLGPLIVLLYSNHLPDMVIALIVSRLLTCVAYLWLCLALYPDLARPSHFRLELVKEMLSFGSWMTVSAIVAPLLAYLGRLFLAVLVSADAVAYFSTPFDVVVNLLTIPGILVSVYFPMFARQMATSFDLARSQYRQALTYNIMAMLPLVLAVCLFARPALAWWINPEFAGQSFRVAQLMALGVFINSIGWISQSVVQAAGRPDLTAKLQLFELVLYVPYLWWLTSTYGIIGTAIAWVIRVLISAVVLWIMADWHLSRTMLKRAAS